MKRWPILLSLMAIITACDQGTKYLAVEHLAGKGRLSMAGDVFRLQFSENTGAFLSLGADLPDPLRKTLFTGLVAIILSVFLYYLLTNDALHKLSLIAGGFMIGGGLGNLIDRIFNDGAVVDFLNIGIGSVRTGIFNVADMSIMLGLVLFLLAAKEDAAIKKQALPADPGDAQEEKAEDR